jgi:hypothetical protein
VAAVIIGALFRHLEFNLEGVHNRTGVIWFSIVYFSLAATSSLGLLQVEVGGMSAQGCMWEQGLCSSTQSAQLLRPQFYHQPFTDSTHP